MTLKYTIALAAIALSGCLADETLTAYADPDANYRLKLIDGKTARGEATISFPEAGKVAGQGPCNAYIGTLDVPLPWFKLSKIAATKRACPKFSFEEEYFQLLQQMTLAEVNGTILLLRNDDGREMVLALRNT